MTARRLPKASGVGEFLSNWIESEIQGLLNSSSLISAPVLPGTPGATLQMPGVGTLWQIDYFEYDPSGTDYCLSYFPLIGSETVAVVRPPAGSPVLIADSQWRPSPSNGSRLQLSPTGAQAGDIVMVQYAHNAVPGTMDCVPIPTTAVWTITDRLGYWAAVDPYWGNNAWWDHYDANSGTNEIAFTISASDDSIGVYIWFRHHINRPLDFPTENLTSNIVSITAQAEVLVPPGWEGNDTWWVIARDFIEWSERSTMPGPTEGWQSTSFNVPIPISRPSILIADETTTDVHGTWVIVNAVHEEWQSPSIDFTEEDILQAIFGGAQDCMLWRVPAMAHSQIQPGDEGPLTASVRNIKLMVEYKPTG